VSKILGTSTGRSSTGYLSANHDTLSVRLVIFVDNNLYRPGLETAGGLSIYVELGNLSILFDRGPNSKVVEANVAKLGADLFMLNFVMIKAGRFN
jgi:metal-dependent hydrolase (beta-lactamase superfamily II)